MTDWSADPWFAQHAWVAPRVGETRRSGFKSLRPHLLPLESREIRRNFRRGLSEFPAVHVPSCRVLEARPFPLFQTRMSPDSSFAATRRRQADTERLSRSACFRNVFRVRSSKATLVFFCRSFEGIRR